MSEERVIEPGRYIHASAVLLGEAGVLITGVSRAGKSSLVDLLIGEQERRGGFARLVGDDRIALHRAGDQIILRGHPAIAGLIERRGTGIETIEHVEQAPLHLVVDLAARAAVGLPAESSAGISILGLPIPRLAFDRSTPREDQVAMILAQIAK